MASDSSTIRSNSHFLNTWISMVAHGWAHGQKNSFVSQKNSARIFRSPHPAHPRRRSQPVAACTAGRKQSSRTFLPRQRPPRFVFFPQVAQWTLSLPGCCCLTCRREGRSQAKGRGILLYRVERHGNRHVGRGSSVVRDAEIPLCHQVRTGVAGISG